VANLQNEAQLIGMFGIFSIGSGIVIITGGIDLSVGSLFAMLGVILAILLHDKHWAPAVVIPLVVGLSTLLGLGHGFLITRVKMQPFIVTLCGLLIYRGLARYIADDASKGFEDAVGFKGLADFCTGKYFGVPVPFIILVVLSVIFWFVLHRSVYGRHLYAAGRNEEAARYSGINTRRVIASAYVIIGFLGGISAILFSFYTNSVEPANFGNIYELYGIAAAVLGGCSLRGGEGSIVGILIGVVLIQVLQNLVNFLNIPTSLNYTVMGGVIFLGVLADQIVANRRRGRQ
jgi:ribose transport system permease protein